MWGKLREEPPDGRTHWSLSTAWLRETGFSPVRIHRWWREADIQPHRVRTFKLSNDPRFEAKLPDAVDRCWKKNGARRGEAVPRREAPNAGPGTHAAGPARHPRLHRHPHPRLRPRRHPGPAGGPGPRHRLYYACAKRHRHQELLAFLRQLARRFPTQQVHLILDNYSPHKHRKVRDWLEANPRFHFHFTPTCSSWLNPVEHWSGALQRQVLARGSFADADALRKTLGRHVRGRNRRAMPPRWKKSADAILAQIALARRTFAMVH